MFLTSLAFVSTGLQRGRAGVRSGDENVGQRPLGGHVLRRSQTAVSHQRKAPEESLDQSVRHHSGKFISETANRRSCSFMLYQIIAFIQAQIRLLKCLLD